MLKRNNLWAGAALLIATALPALAQETTANTIVATVNGTDITMGHMIVARTELPQQYQSLPDDVLYEGLLEQLIQQTLLSQALKVEPSKGTVLAIENEQRSLRAGEVLNNAVVAAQTSEALQAAYDTKYADAVPSKEYNAAHILVETETEAQELRILLDEGADFAELAKEKSTGPSGANGGSLGWFGPGAMIKPFEDAVALLHDGEVSAPTQTQFGWHVILLSESRLLDAPTLEEVREELEAEIQQKVVEEMLVALTEAAEIIQAETGSVSAQALSDISLIEK